MRRLESLFEGAGLIVEAVGVAVIVLGVWGYFVPAIIRINYFSTSQVGIVIFVMLTITPLTALLLKSAKTTTEMVWFCRRFSFGGFATSTTSPST